MADDQKLTPEQGTKLAELIHALRPNWGVKGTFDQIAIAAQADMGNATEICVAAIRAAAEPTNEKPAIIRFPGAHWDVERNLATTRAELKAAKDKLAGRYTAPDTNDPPCPDHPDEHLSTCKQCAAVKTPMPADFRTRAGLPPKGIRAARKPRKQLEPTTTEGPTT